MDKEKPFKNAFDGIDESGVWKIAEILAEREDKDVEEVHRILLRQRFKMLVELMEYGKADVLGIGYFKRVYDDPNRKFKFFRYSEEESKRRQQLMLQEELGGQAGNIGNLPSKEFNVKIDFDFPIKLSLIHI